jgi:hypothetical protein
MNIDKLRNDLIYAVEMGELSQCEADRIFKEAEQEMEDRFWEVESQNKEAVK